MDNCLIPDLPDGGFYFPPPLAMTDAEGRPVVCRALQGHNKKQGCHTYKLRGLGGPLVWMNSSATLTASYGSSLLKLQDGRYWKTGGFDR